MTKVGNVLWIMGLAGVGKTTLAEKIYNNLVEQNVQIVWLDGDTLRKALGITGHTLIERREAGIKYLNIASILANQGINVIISSIGMQQTFQIIGRELFPSFFQVLVNVDTKNTSLLQTRNFYSNGEINVMGKDLSVESLEYDIIFENNFAISDKSFIRQCSDILIYGKIHI